MDQAKDKAVDQRTLTNAAQVRSRHENLEGGKVSITHGGYSFLHTGLVPCDKCLFKLDDCKFYKEGNDCEIIRMYRVEKIEEIMRLPWIKKYHLDRVDNYVRLRCLTLIIDKWLSKVGLFINKDRGLALQPVMQLYFLCLNTQERIADKLFLSPMAEKMAGVDSRAEKTLEDHLNKMLEVKPEDGLENAKEES